jgi:cytochrome c553
MKQIVLLLVASLFFIGCSDKKEEEKSVISKEIEIGQIEVVENKEYKERKTKELESKGIVTGAKGDAFYYDYDKKNGSKKEIKEEKTYTPIEANMRVRTPYDEVRISLLVKKLSKNFIVKCSACHSDYANGIIGPSLIGKDQAYIYDSIMDFKTGKKENVLMDDLIHMMSNAEIEELAQEIAEFNEKIKKLREDG